MSLTPTKNLLLLFLTHLLLLKADSKCQQSYPCRNFSFQFPFTDINYPQCGLLSINCNVGEEEHPKVYLGAREYPHELLEKVSANKFLIHDSVLANYLKEKSCFSVGNLSLLKSPSVSFAYFPNLTTYSCYNSSSETKHHFAQYKNRSCDILEVFYRTPATHVPETERVVPPGCVMNQLPIKSEPDYSGDLFNLLTPNFTLEWSVSKACYECYRQGGQCLTNKNNEFYCKQAMRPPPTIFSACNECYHGGGQCLADNNNKFYCKQGGVSIAVLTFTCIIVILFIKRKEALLGFGSTKLGNEKDIESFLKSNGNLAPLRYKYSDIKKMTKSFSENLGKGGYSTVYKGKSREGQPVAVKVLNESKGNGEEFMNEIASISRTSHVNIVTLLGYCFEGTKRALIYDFMPNGSLEKFIGNSASSSAESGLGWQKLYEIALGIARGLEYLHQGCNTRILHFDIKPHNILLDKDLNPRISDFGLAKLCPNRSSIVSMLGARGTMGYIAPEVFCRNFGEVSHKSDVYSYGMMALEMAGGRKNINRGDVDHTSETYFPYYIYKEIDEMDGGDDGIMRDNESQVEKRKLMIVGLWCIQTNPKDRPSMTKVVEMLEGEFESLQLPPEPCFHSPPRLAPSISTSESISTM